MITESVSWMPLMRESFFMLLKAGQLDQDCLVLLRDDSKLQGRLMRQPDDEYQAREYEPVHRKLKASEGKRS